jgi:hypothetical protein
LETDEHDTNNNNLNKYEYRLNEIVEENVVELFIRLKDKSSSRARKI